MYSEKRLMTTNHRKPQTANRKRYFFCLLALPLALLAAFLWFSAGFYPGYGLSGIGRDRYQAALVKVGARFAASESLTFGSLRRSNFQEISPGGAAYAWGTAALYTPTQEKVQIWIALQWSPSRQRWQRLKCLWLADPRHRPFFVENPLTLGNLEKISFFLENAVREERRKLKEVWGAAKNLKESPPNDRY